jgi:hypothetical protein
MANRLGRVSLSAEAITGWDSPFAHEPIADDTKAAIVKAVRAALGYLQLVETGKIRPKKIP